MENLIKQSCNEASTMFAAASSNFEIKTYDIDCSEIRKEYKSQKNILDSTEFREMFAALSVKPERPAVYVFEIVGRNVSNQTIVEAIKSVPSEFPMPSTSGRTSENSTVLYVGKVQTHFENRLMRHFGVYKRTNTHGLHLVEWANELKLKLQLRVCLFDKEMTKYVGVIEKSLAKKYNPIIGKH